MRVAVVYDGAAGGGSDPDVEGVLAAVMAVMGVLAEAGHEATAVPLARPVAPVLARLADAELVFNLAEGLDGRAEDEPRAAGLLELLGVPMTGAPSDVLALCRRKDRVNALLAGHRLPIPPWTVAGGGDRPAWRRFPAIVKPVGEDGSVGIDEASVVEDPVELAAALARIRGTALVQAFVGGRELNVGLVGRVALPVAEVEFAGSQRVVSYAAKWDPGSTDDLRTPVTCPAAIPPALQDRVIALGRDAWAAVGGSGYGRIDIRLDDDGRPHVLEVNPNPDLAPDAGLARMAEAAGWGYGGLVDRIMREARP